VNEKLVSVEQLCNLVGQRPRKRKVVLCHGVFDIIHPGHIRHLRYAKSKADILVVGITADIHVAKGTHRPHCPEELRADAMANLEMVDYVVIDKQQTPLSLISKLKPDYYAKGYEYANRNIPEESSVQEYGGEVLYTPGDIVYSTTRKLDQETPQLSREKLALLIQKEDLAPLFLPDFSHLKVHVVGDTIIDTIEHTTLIGANAKTPTFSVLANGKEHFVGGAGVVAKHLHAAGVEVVFSTVLGSDKCAYFLEENIQGIKVNVVRDLVRPTTEKRVIEAGGYRLLKIDTVDNRSIDNFCLTCLCANIKKEECDAIIFSDFRHGIFNSRTIPLLVADIPPQTFRVADSQVASRWGNILEFTGFDLLTPNEREARFSCGDQDSSIRKLSSEIYKRSECRTLMLKLGARGVLTLRNANDEFLVLDSFARHVVDPVGAGDAFLAYATLGCLVSGDALGTVLGSIAAGLECEQDGNVPITREMMKKRIGQLQ